MRTSEADPLYAMLEVEAWGLLERQEVGGEEGVD